MRKSECYKEAYSLYKDLADNDNHLESQHQVGLYLSLGYGVSLNMHEAAKYWKLAADQENTSSMVSLAQYLDKRGTQLGVNSLTFTRKKC